MTGITALHLARAQFAFTISFHFIFPAFSIGLASYLAVLEALWLKTGKPVYDNLYRYWIKIFSIVFGMGVVSGLVMSYQFGTNWAVFSDKAGPIVGPLMAYEVLSAFFLEAGFLGVAFEFRWRDPSHRARWDAGFCIGSIVATFAQGVSLGALLQGIKISGRAYAGGYWDWITPFSILTGTSLVVGYALLGACWLIWKTSGAVQAEA